jgi:SAM-dependent methyltransferase
VNHHVIQSAIASRCPFCSSPNIGDTHLRALDDVSSRLYLVYECGSCTGRFVADRPERIDKVEDDAAATFASPERVAEQRAHFDWKRRFDENDYPYSIIPLIERWAPGQRVMDLGCGASQLLPMLMKRGFDVVGFEGDPARAQIARENGVTVVSGDWRKIGEIVGHNRFDCIVSDQVFEHMLDPVGTLRSLKPLLRRTASCSSAFPMKEAGGARRNSAGPGFAVTTGRSPTLSIIGITSTRERRALVSLPRNMMFCESRRI